MEYQVKATIKVGAATHAEALLLVQNSLVNANQQLINDHRKSRLKLTAASIEETK